jgi:hypothetical protein
VYRFTTERETSVHQSYLSLRGKDLSKCVEKRTMYGFTTERETSVHQSYLRVRGKAKRVQIYN